MAAMDNKTMVEKTDITENTVKSLKRKMVVRRLCFVAILLVAFSIILLVLTSMKEKKDLAKRIDHWFEVRNSKLESYSQTQWTLPTNLDEQLETEEMIRYSNFRYALNGLMMTHYNRIPDEGLLHLAGKTYDIETQTISYNDYFEPVEVSDENESVLVPMLNEEVSAIIDADGDDIFITSHGVYYLFRGYVYGRTIGTMGGDGSSNDFYFSFEAVNLESRNASDMKDAAEELFNKGNTSGWYKDFRYACVYREIPEEQKEAFHISDDEKFGTIQFYDASEELKEIRNHTVNNALVLFGGDIVILLVLLVLFSMEKAPVAETEADSAFAVEEKKTEGISKDLTKQLLDYIEQSEKSYGPNGYLDEIRALIEGEKES